MSDCFDLTIIDQLRADLSRVTAERDENYFRAASLVWMVPPDALDGDVRKWSEEYARGWKAIQAESAALRSRVADLQQQLDNLTASVNDNGK